MIPMQILCHGNSRVSEDNHRVFASYPHNLANPEREASSREANQDIQRKLVEQAAHADIEDRQVCCRVSMQETVPRGRLPFQTGILH